MKRIIDLYFSIKFFWILLISAFLLQLFFSPVKPKPYGDNVFNVEAKIIANHIRGIEDQNDIRFEHAVIPTLFYVLPAMLTDRYYEGTGYFYGAVLWNGIFFILAVLLYIRTFEIKSNLSLFIFLCFLIIIPYFIYYQLYFSSEPISFFLLALCCYLAKLFMQSKQHKYAIFLGLTAGILICNRPNFILFIPLSGLTFVFLKRWSMLSIPAAAVISFLLFNQLYLFNKNKQSKNKLVFLIEQIHGGQFFLRKEYTDWSFFNNEFRPSSVDYTEYTSSKNDIYRAIDRGIPPRKAYIDEIILQLKQNPSASLILPLKKLIHSNSIHIGSKIPGTLSLSYIKSNFTIFSLNILLNLINWVLIGMGLFILYKNYNKQPELIIIILLVMISFNLFNMISASEQRYVFPTKILYIMAVLQIFDVELSPKKTIE